MTPALFIVTPLLFVLTFITPLYGQYNTPQVFLVKDAALTHLLIPKGTKALGISLSSQFEVPEGGLPILLTREGNLYDLQKRSYLPYKKTLGITSFTISSSLFVVIRRDMLGWYEDGTIRERVRLPQSGLRIAAGPGQRLYVYGDRGTGSMIYLLEDGKEIPLVEVSRGNISALTAIRQRIFYAVGNAIYTVAKGERPGLLFVAEGEKLVRSLAIDPKVGVLYFSAGNTVYAMRAGIALSVLKGMECYLKYSGTALYALDPKAGRLVKITGLERLIFDEKGESSPAPAGGFKE
ncbi:MAG: hypothetical protein A4E64_02184 [Syntrophorhabdus sp. PtaU1.Bin058]|nr:MAG: hypothetical protein A4E64_02184 [Syntrophorhabdus sp. PtaU1.Bin058]